MEAAGGHYIWPMRLFAIVLLVIGVLCFQQSATAQRREGKARQFVYANLSFGLGAPFAFKASAACLFAKRHELSVGYNYYERRANGIPYDYENRGLLDNQNHYPQEAFRGLAVTYGAVLYPRHYADRLRFVLRAGALIGQQSTPQNFYRHGTFLGANYAYETRERTTAALILHPTIDYTPRRVFGATAGLYAIISSDYSGGGVSFGILLGKVGNRMRQRRTTPAN